MCQLSHLSSAHFTCTCVIPVVQALAWPTLLAKDALGPHYLCTYVVIYRSSLSAPLGAGDETVCAASSPFSPPFFAATSIIADSNLPFAGCLPVVSKKPARQRPHPHPSKLCTCPASRSCPLPPHSCVRISLQPAHKLAVPRCRDSLHASLALPSHGGQPLAKHLHLIGHACHLAHLGHLRHLREAHLPHVSLRQRGRASGGQPVMR